ncbi:golgin subfamily A member 1 [Diabrotica virgifera virgifera]|uniref:GRIP domain-containing protein n=1 Tax=Diabrotica virgifera virgifera TaxID=50390 RepID=A0ABM5L4R6_DIAVI|nr:golgin subfamily A member 1 [Diabrotica virgifera virgifera]
MFTSLKNKIREETGSDLSKLTAKITSSTVQKIESLRGRSTQGSTSSLNSIVSSEGVKEDGGIESDDFKKRLMKLEAEFVKKLDHKETEWRELLKDKDKRIQALEKDREEFQSQLGSLKESLRSAEEFNSKILLHKENNEQLENLQCQELAKVKSLVLLRDQEILEKSTALKDANTQLDKLRSEVVRLRRQEEILSDVQDDLEALRHSTSRDLAHLASELSKSEQEKKYLQDVVVILRQNNNDEGVDSKSASERKLLEQRLEEAHLHLSDIKTSWSDKIASLETQVGRLSRQAAEEGSERRRAVQEKLKLEEKVKQLEAELECSKFELINKEIKIKRLTEDVNELSTELKNLHSDNEEEITFLRTELGNVKTDLNTAKKNLENIENELEKSEDECSKLKISVDSEHSINESLKETISKLEKDLAEERSNSINVQKTLTRVTSEKNTVLLRNAEISQQMELVKQDMRRLEREMTDHLNKLNTLEEENDKLKDSVLVEQRLRKNIVELEDQIMEKNKNIKTLQLRLADMKKTLQQELRTPGNPNYHSDLMDLNSPAILTPTQVSTRHFPAFVKREDEDVNFKYLKHVIFKFLTSREYEAQHLIKAISTLLKFTQDEEKLIQDTLDWKKSWFGSKPKYPASSKLRNFSNS